LFAQGVVGASTGSRICTQSALGSHIRTDSQTHCGLVGITISFRAAAGCFAVARLHQLARPLLKVAESTRTSSVPFQSSFVMTRTTSQCGTTCSDVYIASLCDKRPKDHTASELHRTTIDAAADRREAVPSSPTSSRALQANTDWTAQ
jgi:hypothetical protein